MPRPSLTLYSTSESDGIDHAELVYLLKSTGLIGKPFAGARFLAGPRFFSQIVFIGCAPNILIDPKQSSQHIRIAVPVLSKPELFSAHRACAPHCPACKQKMEQWKQQIETAENGEIVCSHCDVYTPVNKLNFRKRACFSKNIICIAPVFESEAVPADGLIKTLSNTFNTRFSYAYVG